MKLKSVFVRFYKSFNYDYRRKIDPGAVRKPWETANEQFYPHVEIPMDSLITTVVGANESGKSHLLSAIEKALTGSSNVDGIQSVIERKDFCRYSHFFQATSSDSPRLPDFGLKWDALEPKEVTKVLKACKITDSRALSHFCFFRAADKCLIYLPNDEGLGYADPYEVTNRDAGLLPPVFRIDSRVALPDGVAMEQLISGRMREGDDWSPFNRRRAFAFAATASQIESLLKTIASATTAKDQNHLQLPESLRDTAKQLREALSERELLLHDDERIREIQAFNLAYDLLMKIAGIEVDDVKMLRDALRDSETGIVRSVTDKINHALAVKLRFPRIWSQDRTFALRVEATEHELNFIINDRTGCQYSFDERSSGLKHFLSYYIQYLAHEPDPNADFEILLMDEPDAYLSGEAQQDLLKIFQMFADPTLGKGESAIPVQVIYVTHSPFLIDKNHAERVRALEKPEGSRGTRIIKSGAQNHYEPVRSAFGPFVGETTFMSHCNLMTEGLADQILIAGAATYLRRLKDVGESEMLDLNRITIVPAGGADNIPYLTYLARGRDADKPAVIVMLDSDSQGDKARNNLGKDGPHPGRKRVLDSKFILQLGDIRKVEVDPKCIDVEKSAQPFKVLEDLVPMALAVRAGHAFAKAVYGLGETALGGLTEEALSKIRKEGESPFEALKEFFATMEPAGSLDIDKVPFARSVIDLLPVMARERQTNQMAKRGLREFENNMRALFRRLRKMQTLAEEDRRDKTMRQVVDEKIATFLSDFQESKGATRDDVTRLFMDVESDLEGDEKERGFIIQQIASMRGVHNLSEDPTERIADFDGLLEGLERLRSAREFVDRDLDLHVPVRKRAEAEGRDTAEERLAANQEEVPAADS